MLHRIQLAAISVLAGLALTNGHKPDSELVRTRAVPAAAPAPPDRVANVHAMDSIVPAADDEVTCYRADLHQGTVGVGNPGAPDEAYDNLFHIALDHSPAATDRIWLEYEVNGVADRSSVGRSLDHEPSMGGHIQRGGHGWSAQRERIPFYRLHQGRNTVLFGTPAPDGHAFRVRDVRFTVEHRREAPTASVVLTQLLDEVVDGHAYVSGFITGAEPGRGIIHINDLDVPNHGGCFEALVPVGPSIGPGCWVTVDVEPVDGQRMRVKRWFSTNAAGSVIPLEAAGATVTATPCPGEGFSLPFPGGMLRMDAGALPDERTLSVAPLRAVDLPPIDPDMVNVTAHARGFRFLPDGTRFDRHARLEMKYDPALIPAGYGPADVRTFFFDEERRRWTVLPRDTVLTDDTCVIALTDHFTDYINGIIQVPESPETMGCTPTSIKDFKAADVSAGITPLEPPTANNSGSATTRFPLKLPAGRQGMQPDLAIQYSSEGGNGWLGLGWDLRVPSITIDTRWGVPRYDPNKETETYLLDGAMLSPVAHRTAWIDRPNADTMIFHLRVEGSFMRIIRHGGGPQTYWWEVTDKEGTTSYYGGVNGVDDGAVLRAGNNIARWQLVRKQDSNGNCVNYKYQPRSEPGNVNGIAGAQLYPKEIDYTGTEGSDGPYSVAFQLDNGGRTDKQVNCRLGLKEVTAHRLDSIIIKYNGDPVRSYGLEYTERAFYKSLLSRIAEYDANGDFFYEHRFDYYDDVRQGNDYVPYANEPAWGSALHDDDLSYSGLNPFVDPADKQVSLLSGSLTENYSFGGSGNIGPPGNPFLQTFTIGGSFGYARSKGEGIATFADIDGDNLPDKVFRQDDGSLKYRKNLFATGTLGFSDPLPTSGLPGGHFSQTRSRSTNYGFELHAGPGFFGKNKSRSTTRTQTYFSDRNGDGLMDVCQNGKVFFNTRDVGGQPHFIVSSTPTENPIIEGAAIALQTVDTAEVNAILAESPLIDVVRLWNAPYDGWVHIHAPIQLVEGSGSDFDSYEHRDGVRAVIQVNDLEQCSVTIEENDYATYPLDCAALDSVHVQKGDKVYFRLQSVWDGAYDQVLWHPEIRYEYLDDIDLRTDTVPDVMRTDANDKNVFEYRSLDDFLLANAQGISFLNSATLHVDSSFIKPPTSDTVVLSVLRYASDGTLTGTIYSQEFAADQVFSGVVPIPDFAVDSGDVLIFRLSASSNVEWQQLDWSPVVEVIGQQGVTFHPCVDKTAYNEPRSYTNDDAQTTRIVRPYIPDSTGSINLDLELSYSGTLEQAGLVTLTVKRRHELLAKKQLSLPVASPPFNLGTSLSFNAIEGDTVYMEVSIPDRHVSDSIIVDLEASSLVVPNASLINDRYGIYTLTDSADMIFGPGHYRWGQFCYNYTEAGVAITDPIDENLLTIDVNSNIPDLDFGNADTNDLNEVETGVYGNPLDHVFTYMFANRERGAWSGYDDLTYVKGDTMSASRLGEDDVSFAVSTEIGTTEASAPIKVSKENSNATSYGVNVALGWGYSNSSSDGSSAVEMDAMDLDGDRYPDIVSVDKIQGTLPTGGYEDTPRDHSDGAHVSESSSEGSSVGGSFVKPNFGNSASPGAGLCESISYLASLPAKGEAKCNDAAEAAKTTIGVNLNFGTNPTDGADHVLVSWNDVNGDGLPDKVYQGGQASLNIGRSFLPPEPWDFGEVRKGTSHDYGYGGGISISNLSFAFGVSASRSVNGAVEAFTDVNGDGLIDIVTATEGDDEWRIDGVRFNTGCGFSPAQAWPAGPGGSFDRSRSVGESGNASFSYGFVFLFFKVVMNVNGTIGHGFSRTESQFADINGDGFPDLLSSSDDVDLTVRASTIRRTNLLKEAQGPFGSRFHVDYGIAGNTYDLPQSKWVMAEVLVYDGHSGDGPDASRTTFEYADGRYDRRERESYGFGTVRTKQWDTELNDPAEPYRTTVQTYDVSGFYTKGLPLVKTLFRGTSVKFSETENAYQLKLLNGNDAPTGFNTDDDSGTAFPALISSVERQYEGMTDPLSKTVEFGYDDIGNVTRYTDLGNGTDDDVVQAGITYHALNTPYIMSVPQSISITCDGVERRQRSQEIDPNGNITRIVQSVEGGDAVYDMGYEDNGNLKWVKRPANHQGKRMFYDYTYDAGVQTYVTQVHDAFGYRSRSAYDLRFGQLESTVDMNGQKTSYVIDEKGRVASVTGPYEQGANTYTIKLEYHPEADVPYGIVKHHDPEHPGTDISTITFLDGLFRPLQVKKTAMLSDENGVRHEGYIASGHIRYDAFGRSIEQYYPTEAQLGPTELDTDPDPVTPTRTRYDVLDRKVGTTLPDGSTDSIVYDIAGTLNGYAALRTTAFDALGNIKERYTDVRGRQVAMADHGPDDIIRTTFQYNGIAELQKVIDDAGNETKYTYDRLGRKLTYDHPDGGLTEFTYDPAGNLLTKNTANLHALFPDGDGPIKYTYEYQRLKQIDYPRNYQNRVRYVFGDSVALFNRIGRLVLQEDASGGQEFYYGPLGEVVKTIRTILVSQSDIRTFVSEQRYDTWNRVQQMTYPDGEVVDFAYNAAGMLERMTSTKSAFSYELVKNLGYDKFEQRVYLKQGNDVETRYSYEPLRRRLQTLNVKPAGADAIMDNAYTYDAVSNISTLANNRAVPADGQGGSMTSTFGYDQLYRLTSATAHYTGAGRHDGYTLGMAYDNLYNITQKTLSRTSDFPTPELANYDNPYSYQGEKPHAPDRIGMRTYSYDANGNLSGWQDDAPRMGNRIITWDEENRMQAVNDEGYLSLFTYDAGGERVIKSHGGTEGVFINGQPVGFVNHFSNYTLYVSPYMVQDVHTFTKHYYIEGQRIASRLGSGHFYTGPLQPQGITAGGLDYNARTQLMQQAANEHFQQMVNPAPPGAPTLPNYAGLPEQSGEPIYIGEIGDYTMTPPGNGWPQPPVPGGVSSGPPGAPTLGTPLVVRDSVHAGYGFQNETNQPELNRYFYHPDHLGSTTYITDILGHVRQHVEYTAFGELFIDEHSSTDPQPYLFNGKELDRVTGLYYYGARYYDPVMSLWASVDPIVEKRPDRSPFGFSGLNPLCFHDPDGREEVPAASGEDRTLSTRSESISDPLDHIGELGEAAKNYLMDPKTGQWRSTYLAPKNGMSKAENALRNLLPEARSAGNQYLESKTAVAGRAGKWGAVGLLSDAASVIQAGTGGFDLGTAIANGDVEAGKAATWNLTKAFATASNPYIAAFATGYEIGTMLDKKFGLSTKLADAMINKFGPMPEGKPVVYGSYGPGSRQDLK